MNIKTKYKKEELFIRIFWILIILGTYFMTTRCNYDSENLFDDDDVILFNTYNVKYDEEINGKICKIVRDRGLDKFILCNKLKGYFFDYEEDKDTELKVREFIEMDLTRILKEKNNDTVYFFNKIDTMTVRYKISKNNLALFNGVIIK